MKRARCTFKKKKQDGGDVSEGLWRFFCLSCGMSKKIQVQNLQVFCATIKFRANPLREISHCESCAGLAVVGF